MSGLKVEFESISKVTQSCSTTDKDYIEIYLTEDGDQFKVDTYSHNDICPADGSAVGDLLLSPDSLLLFGQAIVDIAEQAGGC